MDILNNDLFPHCHNAIQKIYFLGYMANKLLRACFEIIKTDDRDSYVNKRIDLTGTLLNNLFRNYFNKLVKDMEKQVIREINNGSWKSKDDYENIINMTNIYKIIKSTTIENGLKRALATGDFGIKHTNSNKVGVAQVLNRLTYVSSLSHARRISTPTDKSGKLIPPRKLHNTSFGFLCPAECFDPETPILMWDGTSKLAKDIIIGDVLVDDLGYPTTVRSTCSGEKNMYDIIPDKPNFMKHRVTDNHILTLKIRGHKIIRLSNRKDRNYTHIVEYLNREDVKFQEKYFNSQKEAEEFVNSFNDDDTIDITIENYLKLNKNTKDNLVLFKLKDKNCNETPVENISLISKFSLQETGIGPYVGWQLHDKRGRFCLKDGLVVHNTPEGQSVGIVKNLSYMSHITIYSNSLPLYEYVAPYITTLEDETLSPSELFSKVKVFINGAWVGISDDAMDLYEMLKEKKYKGIINIYTSIIFDYVQKEIRVCNDGGRLTRPLLRVKDNNILLTYPVLEKLKSGELNWNHLLTSSSIDNSVIEYIDPEEQSWSMIATKPKHIVQQNENERFNYTHCEIHPSAIFGILASCIPFPEHNQSPRNTYQCLDVNELVLMSNGSRKRIADVMIGDEVKTFDPNYLFTQDKLIISNSKVVNHFVIENLFPILEIQLESGKKIKATEDHKFMTNRGLIELKTIVDNKDFYLIAIASEYLTTYHFEKVLSYEKIANSLVSDITVESENHTFITSHNILSSNCAQGKQAMGVFATNYENRMDKTAYVLNYPARPLVDTRLMNMIDLNKIPSGCNVIVAIMTHTGYNQEDSLLFNKGSVDRGLFVTTIYHTEKDEDKQKINGDEEIRCKPDPTKTKGMKMGNYNKVNSKGVIPENTIVENRDIIISKVTPIKENRNDHTKIIKFEDQSKIYRTAEETYIDKNYIDRNGEGYNFAKIRLRTVRKPVIGDKFCALPTQQVLTDKGWIEIKDVDIEVHRLATLDANGKLTYEFPSAKFEYDHDDKMYCIQNKQVQITCTLNHRLYVKKRSGKAYELIEAKDVMGKMVRFQKTMENVWPDQEFIDLDGEQYNMDAWLQLLGMFISDGYSHNNIIYITAIKERKQTFMIKILESLKIEYSYSKDGKYIVSGKKNNKICNCLTELSVGALNKYLPEYVWNLSKRQSIVLLEALLQGDGHTTSYKEEEGFSRYGTISVQLANDITRLALHCGWSGIVKIAGKPSGIARIGKRNLGSRAGQEVSITQQHTYYKVSIIRKQNEPWINKKVNESNEEKLIDYKGKVYCVEMQSSHTYYMRETTHSPCLIIGNSSRHGQKGTIGNIIPEADIPFTSNGQKPDIIINPHAIPSRMTIGQLKETVLGKVLVELGLFGDGTSFGEFDVKDICKYLLEAGYEAHGNELLYNGLTGEQHECSIFMGPVFYQRLKHMVNDKSHSRSIGPMVNLTRQPAEGRSRDGGLRFGEMEKDAMVSHGAARFTRGRMYDVSDKYSVYACKKCGLVASYNNELHIHYCRTCDNRADFAYVEIPYACKLLFQELITMNIAPRVLTK